MPALPLQVIEHVHGILVKAMNKWLAMNRCTKGVGLASVLQRKFAELFKELITPESVHKDVKSLVKTWEHVRDNEGCYTPAELRWVGGRAEQSRAGRAGQAGSSTRRAPAATPSACAGANVAS